VRCAQNFAAVLITAIVLLSRSGVVQYLFRDTSRSSTRIARVEKQTSAKSHFLILEHKMKDRLAAVLPKSNQVF